MAKYFLNSSALTKRYKQESGSSFVNSLFEGAHELFYLNLAIIEVRKIFYRLCKYPQHLPSDTQITESEFRSLESRFKTDLQQMQRVQLTEEMVLRATDILEKIWIKSIFDLAQLTAYLVIREEHPDMIFVCSDSNLIEAARQFVSESVIAIPGGGNYY